MYSRVALISKRNLDADGRCPHKATHYVCVFIKKKINKISNPTSLKYLSIACKNSIAYMIQS